MGKKYQNIDSLFQEQLGGGQVSPPAHVKAGINKGIKRKFSPLWLVGGSALLIGTGLFLFMNFGDTEEVAQTLPKTEQLNLFQEKTSTTTETTSEFYPNDRTNAIGSTETTETNTEALSLTGAAPSENNTNRNRTENTTPRTNPSISTTPKTFGTTTESTSSSSITISTESTPENKIQPQTTELTGSSNPTDRKPTGNPKTVETTTPETSPFDTEPTTSTSTNPTETSTDPELFTTKEPEINGNPENTAIEPAENQITAETELAETVDAIDTNQIARTTPDEIPAALPVLNDESDSTGVDQDGTNIEITPPPADDYNPWTIGLTAGPTVPKVSYSSKVMSEQTFYSNGTDERTGWQGNLDATYRIKNGLFVGTGVGFTQFNEDYNYQKFYTQFDSIPIYSDDTLDPEIIGYEVDTVTMAESFPGVNKASYLHIPIHLGTQMRWGKLGVDLYGTVRFNFLTNSQGGYFNADDIYTTFDNSNSLYRSFYTDIVLASKVHYRIFKGLYATGTVQFRPVVGKALKETVSFNKTLHYTHFGLGLTYRF